MALIGAALIGVGLCLSLLAQAAEAGGPVTVTLLHTNDIHSHFRPNRSAPNLGGIARIKTAVNRVRAQDPHALLVDGGDWSEGQIYYSLGAGAETLKMMDSVGYDVAVVGNHDWLNGPDVLLDAYRAAAPSMKLVGANLDLDKYARKAEFQRTVPRYVIRDVNGVKVAFIGLVTYELIYDRFITPVSIQLPFQITRQLAKDLKKQVDAVVVISHNSIKTNERVLQLAPDVDLVIGAHDHRKLVEPVVVRRLGASPGWIVETGAWGEFLGRVDMRVTPAPVAGGRRTGSGKVELLRYRLTQMDSSIPEDAATVRRIAALERRIEAERGPVFHDQVATSRIRVNYEGAENLMGNLVTDAYLAGTTGADLAMEHMKFVYDELNLGALRTVDFYNALSAVYNPRSEKTWTVKSFLLSGRRLRWVLNALYGTNLLFGEQDRQSNMVAISGLQMIYRPVFRRPLQTIEGTTTTTTTAVTIPGFEDLAASSASAEASAEASADAANVRWLSERTLAIVDDVLVGGRPLDPNRDYRIAATNGIIYSIEFLNRLVPQAIPLRDLRDTGTEAWRMLAQHARSLSPITPAKIPLGNRARSRQPDLGVQEHDVTWTPTARNTRSAQARLRVTVHNYGETASAAGAATVQLLGDQNAGDGTVAPRRVVLGAAKAIPALKHGESASFDWNVTIPGARGLYPVTVKIDYPRQEANQTNNVTTKWLSR